MSDLPSTRAADADRERVAAMIGEAFAEGRLSAEEFHERVDLAYAAKTLGDLVPLTADLPASSPVAGAGSVAVSGTTAAEVARRERRGELRKIWAGWISMSLVLTTIWMLTAVSASGPLWPPPTFWPIWPIGIVGAGCLARTINRTADSRQSAADHDHPAIDRDHSPGTRDPDRDQGHGRGGW
jgi:Domain of unknown function (DUF1707)